MITDVARFSAACNITAGKCEARKGDSRLTGLVREVMTFDGLQYLVIQQNPTTGSTWAGKAQAGHVVYQVIQASNGKYVGVLVDGVLTLY